MTFLALDVGTKRVGAAVGNSDIRIASALGVYPRHASIQVDSERIRRFIERYGVEEIVVGLPRELDGTVGGQAESVIEYVHALQSFLQMPFRYQDERFSTSVALAKRRDIGLDEKRGKPTIDAAAAAVILQDFLDALAGTSDQTEHGRTRARNTALESHEPLLPNDG